MNRRIARITLELLAQVPHVHVDRARLAVLGATANRLEQRLTREHPPGPAHQGL